MGTADKTYYLDKDGKVTTDPQKAATVLINEGQEIPKEMADRYGIGKAAPKAAAEPKNEPDASNATTDKKASQPTANKAKQPTKNK